MQQEDTHADTVFVTGATGRLGHAMVHALVGSGSNVRALMTAKDRVKSMRPGTIPFIGKLEDKDVLEEACEGADTVFHFAGVVHVARTPAEVVMASNVEGTKNIVEACRKKHVKHLIFTSSISVYGRKRNGSLTEDSALMPSDKYSFSKMLAEQEITKSDVPYTILRMSNIYGPGFERSFFKVFRAVNEGKMVIVGNGQNHVSLIHINDVVKALMLVKDNPQACTNRIYNLGDGSVYTQEGLVDMAAEFLNVRKPTRHVKELLVRMLAKARGLDSDELRFLTSDRVIDISRIRKDLGFTPDIDIRTGGKQMVDDFLNRARVK